MIGTELLRQLLGRDDLVVTVLVRTRGRIANGSNVREQIFDFAKDYALIGTDALPCDILLCAVGSTMRQAGSEAAFLKVELDIPLALVQRLKDLGRGTFGFVSSTGAGHPRGFYLQTKAAVEHAIQASGVPALVVRPSLLLGNRREFRLGERVATLIAAPILKCLVTLSGRRIEALGRLEPISAAKVAAQLIAGTVDDTPHGMVVLEGFALSA